MLAISLLRMRLSKTARKLYWLYNLNRSKLGKPTRIDWPVKVEGRGNLLIGNGFQIGRHSEISTGSGATLKVGSGFEMRNNCTIRIGVATNVVIGDHFKVESNSKLLAQKHWIIGDHVELASQCSVFSRESGHSGRLTIGNHTTIGDNCIIDLTSDVSIGEYVAIGPNTVIYSHDHDYQGEEKAAWHGKLSTSPVIIGNYSWVASGVTILPGVTIGDRSVIAAGAVVTKSIPPNSLAAGIPARVIKKNISTP